MRRHQSFLFIILPSLLHSPRKERSVCIESPRTIGVDRWWSKCRHDCVDSAIHRSSAASRPPLTAGWRVTRVSVVTDKQRAGHGGGGRGRVLTDRRGPAESVLTAGRRPAPPLTARPGRHTYLHKETTGTMTRWAGRQSKTDCITGGAYLGETRGLR